MAENTDDDIVVEDDDTETYPTESTLTQKAIRKATRLKFTSDGKTDDHLTIAGRIEKLRELREIEKLERILK